ncbi:MAG: DUF2817 domain-containing protein [bacterium]|nr:DUF2817 domain-containing protein [bacterium]
MNKIKIFIYIFLLSIFPLFSCGDESNVVDNSYLSLYHTPDSLETFLSAVAAQYPDITLLTTIGYSTQNRPIRALVISDNPLVNEGEPRVRLTGAIHGDEYIGGEVLTRFITYLTSNYASVGDVKTLVDSRYIVIIPMMNPDGAAVGSRYNANEVDLNRNFITAWVPGSTHGETYFSEPESLAIKTYSEATVFHLSATFHSGAVVVNLPFDYAEESQGQTPGEYNLVKYLGKKYTGAGTFLSNPDLKNSALVDEGTINGGDWYIINGSLQDWSYVERGCIDITVELSYNTPKSESEIAEVYGYNRDSIREYITAAGYGISGQVTSDGNPDNGVAGVEISNTAGDRETCSDSDGYYHLVLEPPAQSGDDPNLYTIKYAVSGVEKTTEDISLTYAAPSVSVDVVVAP